MNANTVTIGECRLSYVHIFKPYSSMPGQDPKYSLVALLPKTNTVAKAQIDEAIVQMELLEHNFYVFMNIETDAVNVVYRRDDQDYGLLETTY